MKRTEYINNSAKPKWLRELHGTNTVLKKRKTGRNDACPCGATEMRGSEKKPKKFKHCCLTNYFARLCQNSATRSSTTSSQSA